MFAELPRLLERAGPGVRGSGSITGLFTVLVEGDDHNEPVADAVRGILDGHVVLDRAIAERGRFPAVNVLRSISRTMPACNTREEQAVVDEARRVLSTYDNMAELIRLGAYRAGADAGSRSRHQIVSEARRVPAPKRKDERGELRSGYGQLAANSKRGIEKVGVTTMKSREALIRLHRFRVDEIRRRLKSLDDMRADLTKKMSDLETMMQEEQRRAAHSDLGRLAYPSFARSVGRGAKISSARSTRSSVRRRR